jgi:multidrug resistance efflux pump
MITPAPFVRGALITRDKVFIKCGQLFVTRGELLVKLDEDPYRA